MHPSLQIHYQSFAHIFSQILKELKARLSKIDYDGILYSQTIEEFIKDSPLSLFKTLGATERPDTVAGRLLEGRIAVFCDGTPFVLTLPFIFVEYFQSADDYDNNYIYSSFNRLLRYAAFFLGTSVPALYVAVTTFHQELIPTSLLLSIATSRLGVPFPTVVEATIMLIGFGLLREAGVRLPQPVGQAVSIVGALVIGEAAVNARLISAPMVVVAATTIISSFIMPKMLGPFIILRMLFLFLAGFIGLYGYLFGIMGLFVYLMSMRSFGVPYTIGVGIINPSELKDTAVRAPWWYLKLRPRLIAKNLHRKGSS
jgi:spore germination protein KA